MLGSLFRLAPTLPPALATSNEPPRLDALDEGRTDNGKGKVRVVDSDDTYQPEPEPVSRRTMPLRIPFEGPCRFPEGPVLAFDRKTEPVLHETPILPSRRTPRPLPCLLYYLISTPLVLAQHAKIDRVIRVILISSLGYIKAPYSSSQLYLSQSAPFSLASQHRLPRIKSNRRRYRLSYCSISPDHICERDRPWVVTTAESCR